MQHVDKVGVCCLDCGYYSLAVIPHANDGIMVVSNVTPSGMKKHSINAGMLEYWHAGINTNVGI